MKTFILIMALLATGCATLDQNGDTPREAEVREWLTTEVYRIHEKRYVIDDMLRSGQITDFEHYLLMEQCDEERRTILNRLPEWLR